MITPQRMISSSSSGGHDASNGANPHGSGGASSGRRVVRSVLESLATNVTPQPPRHQSVTSCEGDRDEDETPHVSSRKGFTEVSTRTNRSRYAAGDEMSALEFLSPPKAQPLVPPRRAASVPQQRTAAPPIPKESSPLPHPNNKASLAKPVPLNTTINSGASSSAALSSGGVNTYTRDEVDALLKSTLDAYVAQRDEEEERVLSQATGEIEALQRMVVTLEEENKILLGQLDAGAVATMDADKALAALKQSSAEEVTSYKKAIGLLKRQCTELTNATTDLHGTLAEAKRTADELQSELVRALDESARAGRLHRDEMEAMRRSCEEGDASHASEVRILTAQLEDARRATSEVTAALERARAEADAGREALVVAKAEAEELRRQVSAQKSKVINVGHQRTAVESAKKEEVRDLSQRVQQLEEACKAQTDDVRKKLFKITTLEAQRDDLRKQLDDCTVGMHRFGDKMALVSQTVTQIVAAAEQLDGALEAHSSASGSAPSSSAAPNPTKRRLKVQPARRCTSVNSRSKSNGPADDGNTTFYQCVLATVSDVVQRLQPIQYVLRDAAGEVAMVLDERNARAVCADDAASQLVAAKADAERARRQVEEVRAALVAAKEHGALGSERLAQVASESQGRLAMLEECRHRLTTVTSERDALALELQTVRKARLEEKALVAAEVEGARVARADAERSAEGTATRLKAAEGSVLEAELLAAKLEVVEKQLAALQATHDKLVRAHKRSVEERKGLEEGAMLSEKEVNILHNKVRTLESSNAGLRKKVSALAQETGGDIGAGAIAVNPKKIASSSIATSLQREVEALQRALADSKEARARELAAAEEAMHRVVAAVNTSCANEAEFLESVVTAVRRFIAEAVGPYKAAVEDCARECGDQPASAPVNDFFSPNPSNTSRHLASPSFGSGQHPANNTTMVVNLSPSNQHQGGLSGYRSSLFSPEALHANNNSNSPPPTEVGLTYGSPAHTVTAAPTPSRALLSGTDALSPTGAARSAVVQRASAKAQLQEMLQHASHGLALGEPRMVLATLKGLKEAALFMEQEVAVMRQQQQQQSDAEHAMRAQQHSHSHRAASVPSMATRAYPAPMASHHANPIHLDSLPMQGAQRWSHATTMLRHHQHLHPTAANAGGGALLHKSAPRGVSPSAGRDASGSPQSSGGLSPSPSPAAHQQQLGGLSLGGGLSAMDGTHSSPRRPPMLRSSSSAPAGPGGRRAPSREGGPALQLPTSTVAVAMAR